MDELDEERAPTPARHWRQITLSLNLLCGAVLVALGVATWSHGAALIVGGVEVAGLAVFALADL